LIVTCQNCATRFKLDDSRVPAEGVRVRCSACEHVFQVDPSAASAPVSPDAEPVEATPVAEDDFSDLEAEFMSGEDTVADEMDPAPSEAADAATDSDARVAIGAIALESVPAGTHRSRSESVPDPTGFRVRLGAFGRTLGWAATVGMIVLVLVGVFREAADSVGTTEQSFDLGVLRAEALHGEWVDTMSGRTLLAVTGELRNPSDSRQRLGTRIRVSLEDASGRSLASPPVLMGLRIRESEVRELPPMALEAAQERASRELGALHLDPGEAVSIQAIFPRPTVETVRFVLSLEPPTKAVRTD